MKRKIRTAIFYLCLFAGIFSVLMIPITQLLMRWNHPEYTETQLFFALWKSNLIYFLAFAICYGVCDSNKDAA